MNIAVHAIILTRNEEHHIARCIASIQPFVSSILVIDSFSTDGTCDIAASLGARVERHKFINHAAQVNFAVEKLKSEGGWLFRIDADEVLESGGSILTAPELAKVSANISGIVVQRRIVFMGQRIRFGGIEPSWQLRLWRSGRGRCEQRWMDEHIIVDGGVQKSELVISDVNLNSLHWWTAKHNEYASREAIEVLNRRHGFLQKHETKPSGAQAKTKRFLKEKIYLMLPGGLRAAVYFFYRYILRFGFLDGCSGFYFHLFQGLWYRSLVDAKVSEIKKYSEKQDLSLEDAILAKTGIDVKS
jgi:glycosyltransferase involved in cell wall biosynthesis